MKRIKTIQFQIHPNKKDKNLLEQMFGIKRFTWNEALAFKDELYQTYKRRNPCIENIEEKKLINSLSSNESIQKVFAVKNIDNYADYKWISVLPNRPLQQSFNDLNKAFVDFYQGKCGYPKFKKKNGKQSIRFLDGLRLLKTNNKNVKIKIGKCFQFIAINTERNNKKLFSKDTNLLSITIKKNPAGKYFASVNYSYIEEKINKVALNKDKSIGIDCGVITTASCSSGQEFNVPKVKLKKINNKIKKLQKKMVKKVKDSNNRNKIRIKLAKLYNKKTNIKMDFNHKLSHYLVKNHDLIVMEDLNIKDMTKNAKRIKKEYFKNVFKKNVLNRSILDRNWGQLRIFVEYKCQLYGKHLFLVAPQYTSQKCSKCGYIEKDNRKNKIFFCLNCNHTMDADLNAAINIKTAGLAGFACRENSLENSMKQELEIPLLV